MASLMRRAFNFLRSITTRSLADREWLRGGTYDKPAAGVEVTEETAIGEVTIFACTRLIACTVASLPRGVFRQLDPAGKQRLRNHPVAQVLRRPNPWMNWFSFWTAVVARAAFAGAGYAQIITDGRGRPIELWPLPLHVRKVAEGGQLFYEFQDGATTRQLPSEKVLDFHMLSFDGVQPFMPIKVAAEAVGLALAAEKFAGRFFGNGSNLAAVLTHPAAVSDKAKAGIKKSWNELYSGVDNAHDIAILEEGVTYTKIGTEPEKSQMNQTLTERAIVMCRLCGVPPNMVGLLGDASYATAEQQNLAFGSHTVRPWCVCIEAECDFKLFLDSEQGDVFMRHDMRALLRGDYKTRMEAGGSAIQNGIYCADEIREQEDENPLPDGKGTDYFHQVNLRAVPKGGMAAADEAKAAAAAAAAVAAVDEDAPADPPPVQPPPPPGAMPLESDPINDPEEPAQVPVG